MVKENEFIDKCEETIIHPDIVEKLKTRVDLIDTSQIEPKSKIEQEIKNTGILIYG